MNEEEICQLLLSDAMAASASRRALESTYRLQFHIGFTFRDATAIVPYLHNLGITTCYASPYLKAQPGSTHGYDIIDHGMLNPEVGSIEDYEQWVKTLHDHDMGQILDTVPNHMGVGTNDNQWWNDVLENGPASRFGAHFDIAWQSSPRPELRDKVLLPVLADLYGVVLEACQLTLAFADGAFFIDYGSRRFPVDPRSYEKILGMSTEHLRSQEQLDDVAVAEFQSILTAIKNLPSSTETAFEKVAEREREKEVIKRRLAAVTAESEALRDHVARCVDRFSGLPHDPASFTPMDELLESQNYRLAYWKVGSDEINYRRFFDVNDLAAIAMERDDVFESAHSLIFRLVVDGKVDGLRIDHPDGLYDPATYLRRLQEHALLAQIRRADHALETGDWNDLEPKLRERIGTLDFSPGDGGRALPLYVAIEKILGPRESLVSTWPVHGTSGYEFVNKINGLFVDGDLSEQISRVYADFTGEPTDFSEVVYRKKLLTMQVSLASELHMLTHQLDRIAQKSRRSRDFTFSTLRSALQEVIACFPVYRSYISAEGAGPTDRLVVQTAVRRARLRNPNVSGRVFRFIADTLLEDTPDATELDRAERRRFAGKFQQVTAPVMAKGVEDTAFYVYNRLVSLNEVGGSPERFGVSPAELHTFLQERQAAWPSALSPLSTHDTKRSEDVRARINVLSEIPREWGDAVRRWRVMNTRHRQLVDEQSVPDANEEFFIYQTLVGAWPLEALRNAKTGIQFQERIQEYMLKALHEAKVHSSWIDPDTTYDQAVQEFVRSILDDDNNRDFVADFQAFERRVSHLGLFNSLSQTLLKLASPGVPDTYQGSELWDFSLVDPDNRRPVDYRRRADLLDGLLSALKSSEGRLERLCRDLVAGKEDGRIKLYLHYRALWLRRAHPKLLSGGDYLPLECKGVHANHVFAFARRLDTQCAVVAVPRLLASVISGTDQIPLGSEIWQDTELVLPADIPCPAWRNLFSGEQLNASASGTERTLRASSLFAHFPVALLVSD
jgi:(1->4)-alpha-D-glucan 1-alpha-D-glucosylmutase